MKLLVLQHLAVEHPGIIGDLLRADGLDWHTCELDVGDAIPPLEGFDAMFVMGGPQDVWQTREHPWINAEIDAIRTFVKQLRRPFLGICLGHQLLAAALDGHVAPAHRGEVGVMDVHLTKQGRHSALLAGIEDPLAVLQWHGAEVTNVPEDVDILAASAACAIQAIGYQERAFGVQFHLEATRATVRDWAAIPAYASALAQAYGENATERLEVEVAEKLPLFNHNARIVYDNFKRICAS